MTMYDKSETDCVQHVVLQATPFCNIDCSYCYLPDRDQRELMSAEVLEALADLLLAKDDDTQILEIRWHAGEPLAAGRAFYENAIALLTRLLGQRFELRHSLQTNATLITDDWCEFFVAHGVRVGVSLDGPESLHDRHRRTRNDRGTFGLAMRGVERLQRHNVAFDTISVVDSETLRQQDEFLDFLQSISPRSVGINVEESEGLHQSQAFETVDFEPAYTTFLERLLVWERLTGIPVREFDRIRQSIAAEGYSAPNEQARAFGFLNVDVKGDVYTFSPELVGQAHLQYRSFAVGTVWSSWEELQQHPVMHKQEKAVAAGVARCAQECDYFSVCGGGAPANKLFENGSFDSTETAMCRCTVKYPTEVYITDRERVAVSS